MNETDHHNAFGQPIGPPLPDWKPLPHPPREAMRGRYCRVEPLDPERHAAHLYEANTADSSGRAWTYLSYGPFPSFAAYREWMQAFCLGNDPLFYAIIDAESGKAAGVAAHTRIDAKNGVMEVGHLAYSPRLQQTRAATEAMHLLMKRAFALGYRRYEWKCDALNAPSRAAAQRLGFSYEGIFRQAIVYKNRSRDTAWFAVTDRDWPALERAHLAWLDPANFNADGTQRQRLSELTSPLLHRVR